MKYGIYFAYWENEWDADYKKYIDTYLSKVKKLGFDILEISCAALISLSDKQLLELKAAAKDKGVIITAGYGPAVNQNLASEDPATVKNAVDFFTEMLRKLNILGVTTIGGGIYSYWPVDFSKPINKDADWARSIKNVRKVGKVAQEYGIDYCLESLNRFEGYLINTCAEAKKFVEEVDLSSVKIMLDTFHMNIEEDSIVGAIRLAGDRLGHFHLGENNRKVPGKGCMPWHEIGCALKDIEYNKNVVMEPFVLSGGTVGADIKVWRDLSNGATEKQLDTDAANSVKFLRYVFDDSEDKKE